MKKSILFCLFALLCFTQALWAQDETIDLTAQGFTNAQSVTNVSGTNCTVTFGLGTNTHNAVPKYYDNGAAVRVYANNTITVTSSKKMTEINLVFSSGGNTNPITVSTGIFAEGTWTGKAEAVTFNVGGTSGHRRVQKVQVTYSSAVDAPVISGNTSFQVSTVVTMTAEEGATIRYTTDGSTPTSSSTIYGSLMLTKTSTVKAVAIKGGVMSNVATMLFVKDVGLWTGAGTKANPFIIDTPEKLDQLASRVNAGDPFDNTYFKMTEDISYSPTSEWNDVSSTENNFVCIGGGMKDGKTLVFNGTFDGDGHTVSGIRIHKSSQPAMYNHGLFGFIDSRAVVKNLTLADCRMTIGDCGGAIVGGSKGTVENCHVLVNVRIHDSSSGNYHGGIVGRQNPGRIIGCTCAATLTIDDGINPGSYGGIIGRDESGTISNCIANGVKLPIATRFSLTNNKREVGTIAGYSQSTVTNCLYTGCTFGDAAATAGLGYYVNADNANEALPANAFVIGTTAPSLRFDADEPNPDVVEAYPNVLVYQGTAYFAKDKQVTVTLNNRTLTKNGNWNTLCLPFDVTISDSPLACDGVEAKVFDNTSSLSYAGVLTLKFSNAPATIAAGTPFIIKWNNIGSTITDPVFSGVTITSTSPTEVESTDHNVKFVGQYSPFSITSDNINEILFISSNNQIGYSRNPRTLKNFRAHFWVQPDASGSSSARAINVDWGDGEASGIMTTNLTNDTNSVGAWYDLQGRKVTKPTKGLYIVNGRKVVIK